MSGGGQRRSDSKLLASIALAFLFLPMGAALGVEPFQFKPGFNLFSPQQEAQLGRESSEEVDKAYPLVTDPQVLRYINDLGQRLASQAPNNNSEYTWTFKVINSPDINAFALPAGYVYVNCGTIAAAENEAQLAGVMAHESGHVVMRHGTHEASEALLAQAPLALLESILGRSGSLTGQLTAMGLNFGVNSILLKNSRDAETEADAVGAYILYRAGYDPHAMVHFFEVVEREYPQRTIRFFADHPNPENRIKEIESEIALLGPGKEWRLGSAGFEDAKQRVLNLPAAPKLNPSPAASLKSPNSPPPPSGRLINFNGYGFSLVYPENWHVQRDEDTVVIIPPGGMVEAPEAGAAQAYGASISRFQPQSAGVAGWGLVDATQELLETLRSSNPNLRVIEQKAVNLKGRSALSTLFETDSPLRGQKERDLLVTARQSDFLFSLIFIAPQSEFETYKPTFDAMLQSLELR